MLNNLKKLLLSWHPFLVSLVIFIILLIVAPIEWNRYRIQQENNQAANSKEFVTYSDLNNDGKSNKIEFVNFHNEKIASVRVYKGERIINQWNFDGHIPKKKLAYFVGDKDEDERKEVYCFTFRNDSVLLNIVDPLSDSSIILKDRFITSFQKEPTESSGCNIKKGGFADFNEDGIKEFYFSTTAGYNRQPRRVFIYDIKNDSLKVSEKAGIALTNVSHFYTEDKTKPLITGHSRAFGNHTEEFPYTDQKGWLMVFDHNLDFFFKPVSFDEYPMRLLVKPFKYNGETYLFAHRNYWGSKSIPCALYVFNMEGNLVHERKLKRKHHSKNTGILIIDNDLYALSGEGDVHKLDFKLNTTEKWKIEGADKGMPEFRGDLDNDGKNEYILKGKEQNEFLITNEKLRHPVSFNVQCNEMAHPDFTVIKTGEGEKLLYAESDQVKLKFSYGQNDLYNFRFLVYVLLFGAIWFIVWLFSHIQNRIVSHRFELQQRINELQLKSVKNHMAPHTTFNLLNSISALLNKGDIEKADDMIGKYAKLLRHSVIYSDKTVIPLSEEINYISHYLEIEQYRFNNSFDYSIDVYNDADLNISVPKSLLHTFVENAVKHGVRHLVNKRGMISIGVSQERNVHKIEIKDNGIGREKAAGSTTESTQSGLKSIDKIIRFHNQYIKKQKISYQIQNLKDESHEYPGTHVIIYIRRYGRKK
ncbi:MAG: histidine kinase [Bacteroidales bacterium]